MSSIMDRKDTKTSDEEGEYYEFEAIVSHRINANGSIEYFVKWKGYPDSDNTWEPASSFDSSELLQEYYDNNGLNKVVNIIKNNDTGSARKASKKTVENNSMKQVTPKMLERAEKEAPFIDLLPHETFRLQPERVINVRQMAKDNRLVALIKWKNFIDFEYVPAEWANAHCPELVIQFYESRIYWKPQVRNTHKDASKSKPSDA